MRKNFAALTQGAVRPLGFASSLFRQGLMAAAMASVTMFYSTLASALGMGEITLHSALNQPLNADIELIETGGLAPEDIIARLASVEDFARAGVERVFFFNDLRFTPVIRGNRGVIHVQSNKPVTEPYLHFLVQLVRPNGDLLHEYTLLLDPATSPEGMAATRGRTQDTLAKNTDSRMPVAPPAAVQGKHYAVVAGDTLSSIAKRLQGPGAKASAATLATGIKALNPQTFPNGATTTLKPGQALLLPDAAVLPDPTTAPAAAMATAAATAPQTAQAAAEAQRGAEMLTTAAIENQALSKTVDDLKAQMLVLQEQTAGKEKEVTALRTELAELKTAPVKPQVVPVPVTPVVVAPVAEEESLLTSPLLWGAVLVLLLLLGLALSVRRNRGKQPLPQLAPVSVSPARPASLAPGVPVFEVPDVAPRVIAPAVATASAQPVAAARASAAPDALDGVSIYIAYGRFAEAMGILRDALQKQPERDDIRIRILELLAEQGDSAGFAKEERSALDNGVEPEKLREVRSRYPQLQAAEQSGAVAPIAAAVAAAAVTSAILAKPASQPEAQPAPRTELAPAPFGQEPVDEFQLNLDDLSMDADWDLVDPFDNPKTMRGKPEVEAEPEHDPLFASNLTEFPEVFEIPEDQFLSDFSEPDSEPQPEVVAQADSDGLDDSFLDGFMDDSSDFDLLDLDEAPLSKINQAQVLIDDGDAEGARELLLQVIEEGDEDHQQTARDMLSMIG